MNAKKDEKKAKVDNTIADEKILQIIPVPAGTNAHYTKVNESDQPVTGARQVIALALVESDGVQSLRALTIHDVTAEECESGEFSHITI